MVTLIVPQDPSKRAVWIEALELDENSLKSSVRVCSRHFPEGDPNKPPCLSLGKVADSTGITDSFSDTASTSQPQFETAHIAEQLETNYSVHELPELDRAEHSEGLQAERQLIDKALLTRVEVFRS